MGPESRMGRWFIIMDTFEFLKESNPIKLAEFAVSRAIHDEPAFAWWVNHTFKKRNIIVKAISKRSIKRNMKFGVTVPQTVEEAKLFDIENGTNLWQWDITK